MKKFYYLIATAIMALTFTSCEDVPEPFGQPVNPNKDIPTVDPKGTGTQADPFNVAAAVAKCKETGTSATSQSYYIKGIASEEYTVDSYQNVTVKIVDVENSTEVFTVYRCKGADGKGIPEGTKINVGDEIVVYGPVVNYKDNTPETSTGAYIVSINGVPTGGGGGGGGGTPSGEAKGTGTQADPFNIAAAIAKCKEVGTTASTEKYYIKGIVVKGGTASGGYGNVSFDMGDTKESTDLFKAYQVAGTNGEKLADGYEVKVGDEVVIYGPVVTYGSTYETSGKSAAQIVTINGKGTDGSGGGATGGDGTESNPFNIAEAIAKCQQIGETASTEKYYVKGIVVTGGTVSGGYGNVTFKMGDTQEATELFTAYQVAGSDGEKLADGYEVKVGDVVIIYGPLVNYKGNTPETPGKSAAQIVTINGKKTNEASGGGSSEKGTSADSPLNIAEAIAKCQEVGTTASTDKYYIKGIADAEYTVGSYYNIEVDLVDSEGASEKFKVYRCKYGSESKNIKQGFKVNKGDVIIVYGPVVNFKSNTPETASGAYIVSINGQAPELQ